jgi:23S rRNA (pseudouridine1915-N3)-methyltransferase
LQKILIACIGKISSNSPEYKIIHEYSKRIATVIEIKEFEVKKKLDVLQLKAAEAEILLNQTFNYHRIALDEHAKQMTSIKFASYLNGLKQKMAFIIGGAYGLDNKILQASDNVISLSEMTMPHMLVRAILVEQIYRATTIINNHPYHK